MNSELKEPLKMLGFVEKEGTGIQDIKESLKDNNNPIIEYDVDGDERNFTSATIYANKEFVELMQAEALDESKSEKTELKISLSEDEKIIYNTIANNPGIRKQIIIDITKINKNSVEYSLKKLKKKDLITFDGSKKNGIYFINRYSRE